MTREEDLAFVVALALSEQRRRGLWREPVDVRRLEGVARQLKTGELMLAPVSGTGHETRAGGARLVTIGEALAGASVGTASGSAQSLHRKVRRWAEQGRISAELHGKTYLVDPDEVRDLIGRRTA